MSTKVLSLVIPFHRFSADLYKNINLLLNSAQSYLIDKIILSHNGPLTGEYEKCRQVFLNFPDVIILHTDNLGLGYGCIEGIKRVKSVYLLITAIDFPFELSDIVEWEKLFRSGELPNIAIGSKLHPQTTIIGRRKIRLIFTFFFLLIKKILIPIKLPRDTQGTIFLNTSEAQYFLPECNSKGFFFTTEIVALILSHSGTFVELPVYYLANEGKSSVSLLKDGFIFIYCLLSLRKKILRDKNAK